MNYTIRILSIVKAGSRAASEVALNTQAQLGYFRVAAGGVGVDEVTHWLLTTKSRRSSLVGFSGLMLSVHERQDTGEYQDDVRHEITDAGGLVAGYVIYDDSDGGDVMPISEFLDLWGIEIKRPSLDGDSAIDTAIQIAGGNE